MKQLMPTVQIQNKIHFIRGVRVMLDVDLAQMYGVSTSRLNEQVKRNLNRFPDDFMVRLTIEESETLLASKSQFAILKRGQNIKKPHAAFTEQGIAMLSSVLRSERAVQVNIMIMRAFVQLRALLASHHELAIKLQDLEKKTSRHDRRFKKHAAQIRNLFNAIWELMEQKRPIGFKQ